MTRTLFGLRARIVLWVGAMMGLVLVIGLPAIGLLVSQREWRERQQIVRGVDAVVLAWHEHGEGDLVDCAALLAIWPGMSITVDGERVCGDVPDEGALRLQRAWAPDREWVATVERKQALEALRRESLAAVAWLFVLVVATLIAIWRLISRWIVAPLHALRRASERIAEGSAHVELPPLRGTELALLNESFRDMAARLASQREEIGEQLEALEASHAELLRAQEQLVRSERLATAGRLSAGLAHEIGNPLSAVMGMADALQRGGLSEPTRQDLLDRIRRELERIHALLGRMLTFARAPNPTDAGCEPAEVVQSVVTLLAHDRRANGLDVLVRPPADGWASVAVPADALQQVLLNLLLNACDALRAADHEAPILLVGERTEGGLAIHVEDEGEGMSEDVLRQATSPFFTTRPPGQGTGLGLAVCEQMVVGWGGELRFTAGKERGLRVTVILPWTRSPPPPESDGEGG